jgi:hypothetical protein
MVFMSEQSRHHHDYPEELIGEIRELFAKEFVFEGEVALEDVEEVLALGYDVAMEKLKKSLDWRLPEDVHRYISWFACFRESKQTAQNRTVSPLKTVKKQKEKCRNNRKLAKSSKRKNRK